MGINLNKLRSESQRLKNSGSGGGGFLENFVKMPEGDGFITVRLLPPFDSDDMPFSVTRTHRLGQKNLHCLCTLVGDKWQGMCPGCDLYRYTWKESDQASSIEEKNKLVATARSIKPVERYYYNAVVRVPGQPSQGTKILSIGKQLHERIIGFMMGDPDDPDDEGFGDVTDLQNGRDLRIKKEMTKGIDMSYPKYDGSKFLAPSVAGTASEVEQWLANRHDLKALRQVKTIEEFKKEIRVFRGLEPDPNMSFDPAEFATPTPATVRSTPAPKQAAKVEDADESLAEDDFLNELRNI